MDEAYFLYAGWLWYWIGSVGYFLADCLSGFVPDWLYFVLALVFVLDALLYLMAWRASESPKIDVWFWSEIVNVFASLFTAVAAGLYLVDFPKESALASQTFLMLQSGLYFTGTTLFFLNAVMCFSMFRRSRSIPLVRDPAFCAELFNLVPGAGYWGTSVLQLVAHAQLVTLHDSSSALYHASVDVLRLVRTVNIAFDLLYCVDALFYGMVWIKSQSHSTKEAIVVPVFRFPGDYGQL